MKRFEVEPHELHAAVHAFDSTIIVLIVTEEGPAGFASKKAVEDIFNHKCITEKLGQLTKEDMLICSFTRGTLVYEEFVDLYGVNVVPIVLLQNRKLGSPTGCLKIDLGRCCYCVLLLENAISAILEGIPISQTSLPPESCDKFVDASLKSYNIRADEDSYEVKRFDSTNDTHEVEIQCNGKTILPPRQHDELISQRVNRVINRISRVTTNRYHDLLLKEPVWFIDKTSELPAGAISRLQILLPNRGPIYVAVTNTATILDVCKFVSVVLDVPTNSLEISSRYPYHTYSENEMLCTIRHLLLVPSAVLIIKIIRTAELVQPDRTVTGIIYNFVAAISEPFLAVFSGFWSRIQSMFYSPPEELEADNDGPPHMPTNSHQSNVFTLFDEDDDEDDDQDDYSDYFDSRDRVPNYNGNSTQLL